MIPTSYELLFYFLAIEIAFASVVGLSTRLIVAASLKHPLQRAVVRGAMGGAATFLVVSVLLVVMPFPRNTITRTLENGQRMTSTMNQFQYPLEAAFGGAAIIPAVLEAIGRRK